MKYISLFCVKLCEYKMIHEGEILEKAIRSSGVSIAFLANKTGYSRRHFYNLFNNDVIPMDLSIKVGDIINYDFSLDLKKLNKFKKFVKIQTYEETDFWKNKYLDLLEKYNLLLENNDSKKSKKEKTKIKN